MLNKKSIREYIQHKDWTPISNVRLRASDEAIMLYVPQDKLAPRVTKGYTSLRQLNFMRKHLAERYSTSVEVILFQGEEQLEIEAGFNRILNRKFGHKIVSLFLSFGHNSVVDAFIEATELSEVLEDEITVYFQSILISAEFELGEIHWLSSPSSMPTSIAVLRMVKELQPLSLDDLATAIRQSYESVPERWLRNELDKLRRKGLIIWQKSTKTYVLTHEALSAIPAGARRSSSDIDRALALGKRQW